MSTWVCTTCRAAIDGTRAWYRCSVSSCNSGRMKLRFCTVACWEAHVPTARHRHAECVEVGPRPQAKSSAGA